MTELAIKGTLGGILSASRIINEAHILKAIEEQKRSGCRFGEALLNLGLVTQEDIDWALSNQLDIPYIRLKQAMIDQNAIALIPAAMARTHNFIPLIRTENVLNIAISDPLNRKAIEEIEHHTGLNVNISVSLIQEIREMIELCYGEECHDCMGFISTVFSEAALELINADISGQKLLEYLLVFTIRNHLSSLSLQPYNDSVNVSAKRSGSAQSIGTLQLDHYAQFTNLLYQAADRKLTVSQSASANLSFSYKGQTILFQIAAMPGNNGDYITIRRQISSRIPARLIEMHLPKMQESAFAKLARAEHGITFFASRSIHERCRFMDLMLEESDTEGKRVIILGDGPGHMHKKFPHVTFPKPEADRARLIMDVLDHDPDILLIEDVTDAIVFTAACRAAMRGKLVLAGLDIRGTNNVLRQLLLFQLKNYYIPNFVNGLVSFKGIQILCPDCRFEYSPPREEISAMRLMHSPARFYRTSGCPVCSQSGFRERRFLMDNIIFDSDFLEIFTKSNNIEPLEKYLQSIGYCGIELEGLELLHNGEVSPEEYIASVVL